MDSKTLQTLRRDAEDICRSAIEASVPDAAIQRALAQLPPCQGRTVLVSIGKAGWQTAKAAYDAYPETDTGEAKKMAYDAWQKAIGDRDTYKNGTYASKESAYTTAQKAYADAQKANSDLAQAVTNAQSRKDKADTAVSSKQQAVTTAADNVTKAKEALKKAQDNLNNAASATEAKAKMDAAQKELEAAKKTYTDAQTAESTAKTKMETAKKAYDDLKNNRYRYVYESSAAGDASAKASWEENSGRYLGNPTIKKIRVADAPTGATSSAMSYIYCVAIKVNDRSSTDSRDVFGEITVKQTRGDRENRFENVVLDLAIEIGYKSSSDTDVGEGVIPEKAAIFKKGDGFEQDSEFIFEFEADPDSSFVVNTVGQGSITLGMTTDPDEDLYDDILDEYPDAYVDFFNGNYATFNRTGTLYLAPSDGEDNYYVYSIDERGNVARVSAEWDSSEDAYAIKTRTLGRYFLSSERLSNSFLSSINGTSPSRPSSGSGSSSSSTGSGDLVVVPAPTIPSSPSSTPTYNPPSSSSQASSSSSSQSSSSSSSEEASEPEEESSAPEEDPSSEPEEVVDVDTNADDTDGPKKGGSALVWVLIIVGLLAAGGDVARHDGAQFGFGQGENPPLGWFNALSYYYFRSAVKSPRAPIVAKKCAQPFSGNPRARPAGYPPAAARADACAAPRGAKHRAPGQSHPRSGRTGSASPSACARGD